MILAIPARMGQALHGSRHDSSPFDSSQQTTEGELYAGNAQSSSRLTGEPVAYLLGLVILKLPMPCRPIARSLVGSGPNTTYTHRTDTMLLNQLLNEMEYRLDPV